MKIDRVMHAFLDGKGWTKYWNWCQRHDVNYYLHISLGRLIKRLISTFTGKENMSLKDLDIYAIGQSHMDLAWLWTKLSTIRRSLITSQQAINHFEKYPHFTFSQTQPQIYEWIKKLRPELFEKVKEYEAQNRWEIVGGMWVEPDVNLPNGESLVRQRLYGQHFFLENFGKIAKIECLEDTFGFNAQLPQILVKSGAEGFWTTKITWNDYTEFPFANFMWRGIDGSEIFTHMFLFNFLVLLDLSLYMRTGKKIKEPNLIFNSSMSLEEMNSHLSDEQIRTCGIFYGFGDGGMGPLKEEVDIMTNIARAGRLKFTTTEKYFEILKKECGEKLPIWDDELYLELHRGVYTSQANIKRLNRACEINLRNCELLLTIFALFFNEFKYPAKEMNKSWKALLFNQFHDILPGSSIQDVYLEQENELENVLKKTDDNISRVLKLILIAYLKKQGLEEQGPDYIIIVNTLPWKRDGYIKINEKKTYKIKNMLPISFKIMNVKDLVKTEELKIVNGIEEFTLKNEEDYIFIENSRLILKIKKLTGRIVSLIYKNTEIFNTQDRELILPKNGIGINVYQERRNQWPAWEIYKNFTSYPVNIGIVKGIKVENDDSEIKTVKIIYKFKETTLSHHISLRRDSDMIEFKTDIDARNKKLLFKVRFPMDIDTNQMTCEIPYGNIKRKIIPDSKMEKGKWEFPSQKYVDISEETLGVTIINDSKYGFSSNKKGIYLTLLHTPKRASTPFYSHIDLVPKDERTKYLDIGFHSIKYALWCHDGDFKESLAWRKGYEFNYPLLHAPHDEKISTVPELSGIEIKERIKNIFKQEFSVISISNPNVVLQVIKLPEPIASELEGSEDFECDKKMAIVILRLFETSGANQSEVEIAFDKVFRIIKGIETDLLEGVLGNNYERPIKIKDRCRVIVDFNKFEIKTIKLCVSL